MLCQLCSSLDLAAIMQLRLKPDFSPSWSTKHDFPPEKVPDFEEDEQLIKFHIYGPHCASYKYEEAFVPYHKTLEELCEASNGCNLCHALLQSAARVIKIRRELNDSRAWYGNPNPSPSGKGLFLCGLGNSQGIQLMALDEEQSYALLGGVGFSVDDGSALGSIIHGRTISKSPRSNDSLRLIQEWLLTCSAQHEHHISPTMKPSRLLQHDESRGKVFLCTSFPPDIKYAALSHCWGSVQPLILSTGNKHQLEDGLPLEAFPKTFQDALWVVQQLEIPYIWIDSLCIVQDDHDDWVHESARMCDVYGNAYLTIAATRARTCSEGFLGPREGPDYTYVPFNWSGMSGNVAIFPMPINRIDPHGGIVDLEEEPLSKRAWVLQERYLSPRTIHFASTQMYFECRSAFYPQDRHLQHKDSKQDFKIHRRETARDNVSPEDAWDMIVMRYTERYLTVDSDKLPAIEGLAARVFLERGLHSSPREEYLAGLWRKDLLSGLAWQAFPGDGKRSTPTTYTAPSWSWASVNGPVAFMGDQDTQSFAVIKEAEVDLENSESPFGRVTGGWVHLSGVKLHPYKLEQLDDVASLYFREGDGCFRINTRWDPPRCDLPEIRLADYEDRESDLFAVPLMLQQKVVDKVYNRDYGVPGANFLILISSTSVPSPVNGLPCFRRVGLGMGHDDEEEENNAGAREGLRDRCLEAIEQETLEDFIII
ncbi:hypothetical protein LB507_009800 [Fusarium sp. FIESC RH6]|nr:hypothetical protein LB507_009800 [Fusarium sp. FIESC RH6]